MPYKHLWGYMTHTSSETALYEMVIAIPAAGLFERLPEICAEVESFWEYYGYEHAEYAVDMLEGEGIDENSDAWDILAAISDHLFGPVSYTHLTLPTIYSV